MKTFLISIALLACFTNKTYANEKITHDRSLFPYELLSIESENNAILFEGYGLLRDQHHFLSDRTHAFSIVLKSKEHSFEFPAKLKNINLSYMMQYRGHPWCKENEIKKKNCNYRFKNVGFTASIPLDKLQENIEYDVYLKLHSKILKQSFMTPLYYPQPYEKTLKFDQDEILLKSSFKNMGIHQFYHTLVARTGPSPYSQALEIGGNCSKSYGNTAFFKENTHFKHILDTKKHQNLVTYFQVRVKDAGCHNMRKRVIESSQQKDPLVFLPSLYVNFTGESLKIKRIPIYRHPVIYAKDFSILQYEEVDLKKYAKAIDEREGDITHRIDSFPNKIDSRRPGKIPVRYYVQNKWGKKSEKQIIVTVQERMHRFRYIDSLSLYPYIYRNLLWNKKPYQDELLRALR